MPPYISNSINLQFKPTILIAYSQTYSQLYPKSKCYAYQKYRAKNWPLQFLQLVFRLVKASVAIWLAMALCHPQYTQSYPKYNPKRHRQRRVRGALVGFMRLYTLFLLAEGMVLLYFPHMQWLEVLYGQLAHR